MKKIIANISRFLGNSKLYRWYLLSFILGIFFRLEISIRGLIHWSLVYPIEDLRYRKINMKEILKNTKVLNKFSKLQNVWNLRILSTLELFKFQNCLNSFKRTLVISELLKSYILKSSELITLNFRTS